MIVQKEAALKVFINIFTKRAEEKILGFFVVRVKNLNQWLVRNFGTTQQSKTVEAVQRIGVAGISGDTGATKRVVDSYAYAGKKSGLD